MTADGGATVIASDTFVGPACTQVGSDCISQFEFTLDPGDEADYKVWTLEADNATKVTPPLSASMVMPPTAPDPIGKDGSTWTSLTNAVRGSWNLYLYSDKVILNYFID